LKDIVINPFKLMVVSTSPNNINGKSSNPKIHINGKNNTRMKTTLKINVKWALCGD
jgi:hypothetical protein